MIGIGIGLGRRSPVLAVGGGGGGDPPEIAVNAVDFDGTNDYLLRGADFTGNADGVKGTFVSWVKMNDGDADVHTLLRSNGGHIQVNRHSDGKVNVVLFDPSVTMLLNMATTNTFLVADGWFCILASWDLSVSPLAQLYIGDVNEKVEATKIAGTVNYTEPEWAIGAHPTAFTIKLNGCLAQFYFNPEEYIDFSVESNRRKFISAAGKPVDMGADGSDPTGNVPLVFLSGATASWHTNKGDGDGMTENGALTDCATSPSD